MEDRQQLPNGNLVLIFGIVSIITALCCYGFIGLIFGIVGLVIANKTTKLYYENPEIYYGFENLKAGKICSIIGIIIGALYALVVLVYILFFAAMMPWEELFNQPY